ncbi:hypothetical protein ACM2L6_22055, partial [Escherichia coli]|uniref:hypothetical protein n=1 Tax=Escherichia coli TaxID=562 RepID=UPI001F49F649
ADRNRSHWSTSKTPSYTKSVSWQHHPRNKHASHIEIFAKIVHEISFFSTNPGYKYSSAPQYSTALNLSPPPRTSDNGLKSLRPLATTLLNKENLA